MKQESKAEAWQNDEDRLLAYQVIDEFTMPQRVKNQKTGKMETREYALNRGVRWVIKYTLTCEVYGLGEVHPSTEYLVQKYNDDMENEVVKGHASKRDMQNWISMAKNTGFISTTNWGKRRTLELNMVFLRERMLETRTRDLARQKIREVQLAELKKSLVAIPNGCEEVAKSNGFVESRQAFRSDLKDSQMRFRCNLDENESQNNRGNFAPNGNGSSKGSGKLKKERKKQGTYDEIFEKMGVSNKLRESFVEFIKFRKLAKSPMTDKAIELAIKKVRRLTPIESEQIAIIEQSIERGWKGLFPLKENDNPQSRTVSETQVRSCDISEAMTQNPNVKKLFDLWEDCFGIRPLETAENIEATEALLKRFRDKATWLIGGLARSKNDNYVPKEFSTIATPSDLWKKSDLMWNYILNHKDEWKKADEFQAAFN